VQNIDLLAIWFLLIFGLFVPYIAYKSGKVLRTRAHFIPRKRIFINILVMQALFLAMSLFTARQRDIPLFRTGHLPLNAIALALAVFAAALLLLRLLWRFSSDEEKQRMLIIRPNSVQDLPWWFFVSLAAGAVEEITYRGVMYVLVLPMTRNWWLTVAICVFFFALGHAQQGLKRGIFIALIAFTLHVLVGMTGSLYLAMALHFTYDFVAGFIYLRWAQSLTQQPQPASS
jgi:membrane protease YdiL (CAAX protease family)